MLSFTLRMVRLLNHVFLVASGLFLILMMLHIALDVILRNCGISIQGTLEVVSFYYMVCLVFLPMGYVEFKHQHIRVDLIAQRLPRYAQLVLYVFSCLIGLLFFGMLGWQTLLDALQATRSAQTAMANFTFYIWPARWALPFGFFGLCCAVLANLLLALKERRSF
ncbi:TRAP transporter small permease [uncultured Cohaesibacter sp.]|uniref:TRAP transporter small permease n=1 Tax=uncultured Cohaesibacter sp. TaxID=1002546 RepID=UPI0029C774CC|nr:TRAP transporter small permease [uncultured Cohaesibacter sp.]